MTGYRDTLLVGGASNDYRQHPIKITALSNDRISIDFCIYWLNDRKEHEHSWYKMQFNKDFKFVLEKY